MGLVTSMEVRASLTSDDSKLNRNMQLDLRQDSFDQLGRLHRNLRSHVELTDVLASYGSAHRSSRLQSKQCRRRDGMVHDANVKIDAVALRRIPSKAGGRADIGQLPVGVGARMRHRLGAA